jgi:hypothetical protein
MSTMSYDSYRYDMKIRQVNTYLDFIGADHDLVTKVQVRDDYTANCQLPLLAPAHDHIYVASSYFCIPVVVPSVSELASR